MSQMLEVRVAPQIALIGNRNLVKCVLAINAAGAATLKTTGVPIYTVDNVLYTRGALAAQVMSPGYTQPPSKTVYYVVTLDAAGTVRTRQGDYDGRPLDGALAAGASGIGASGQAGCIGDGDFPTIPLTETPIGVVKVVTNASTSFVPGTTLLDAAGLTVTMLDVAQLPGALP